MLVGAGTGAGRGAQLRGRDCGAWGILGILASLGSGVWQPLADQQPPLKAFPMM